MNLNNTLDSMTRLSGKMMNQLKSLVDYKIRTALLDHVDNIDELYLVSRSEENQLMYLIRLQEDSFESEERVMEVISAYNQRSISNRITVCFQFLPRPEMKFFDVERIEIH